MSGHSPAPWSLDPAYQSVVVDADGEQVAAVVGKFVDGVADESNARLIIAAPELLALARKVADAYILCGELSNPDGLSLTEEDREAARALVAHIEAP